MISFPCHKVTPISRGPRLYLIHLSPPFPANTTDGLTVGLIYDEQKCRCCSKAEDVAGYWPILLIWSSSLHYGSINKLP